MLIPLHDRAGNVVAHATVDRRDYQRVVREGAWCLLRSGYVVRTKRQNGRQLKIYLHRFILGLGPGDPRVDHRNHDKLDNRRSNLRTATGSQNNQNRRGPQRNSTSGRRGVIWDKAAGKWRAQAQLDGKYHFLGNYDDIDEADRVASEWRSENMPYATKAIG